MSDVYMQEKQADLLGQKILINTQIQTDEFKWDSQTYQREEDIQKKSQKIQSDEMQTKQYSLELQQSLTRANAITVIHGEPMQTLLPVEETSKQRNEKERRAAEAREYTSVGDHISYAMHESITRLMKERKNSLYEYKTQMAEYRLKGNDSRVVVNLCTGYRKNSKGEPLNETEAQKKQKDKEFIEDYLSCDVERRWKYLRTLTDEMINLQLDEGMLDDAYIENNVESLAILTDKMMMFENIKQDSDNAEFFDSLTEYEKDMLDAKWGTFSGPFGFVLANIFLKKGVKLNTGEYTDDPIAIETAEQMLPVVKERLKALFETSKKKVKIAENKKEFFDEVVIIDDLKSEIEKNGEPSGILNPVPMKESEFFYGLPNADDLKTFLQKKGNVSEELVEELMTTELGKQLTNTSDKYFKILNDDMSIQMISRNFSELENLVIYHQDFVKNCENLCNQLNGRKIMKKRKKEERQKLATTIGFVAMKTMSYSATVANLKRDFEYSVTVEGNRKKIAESIKTDKLGIQYEGVHGTSAKYDESLYGSKYQGSMINADGIKIGGLDQEIRESLKKEETDYTKDMEFLSIIMTCEAYENYILCAQIPACKTKTEQDAYQEKIKVLTDYLLAYNDRMSELTRGYLDKYSKDANKETLCKALERIILGRDTRNLNFELVGELVSKLRKLDFNDTDAVDKYTDMPFAKALRNVRLKEVRLNAKAYQKLGGAMSESYVPKTKKAGNAVYRKGNAYRESYEPVTEENIRYEVELDEKKGSISGFRTTEGRKVDSHKTGRDISVSKVNKLLKANVIADANYSMFTVDNETFIGTEMEHADGMRVDYLRVTVKDEMTKQEDTLLHLFRQSSMEQIYWLQVVDVICGSVDRHTQNFFVKTQKDGSITKITGIDNDMSFGEIPPLVKQEDYTEFVESKKKTINADEVKRLPFYVPVYENAFPCITKEIYDAVQDLTPESLGAELRGYLRDREIEFAVNRLMSLKYYFIRLKNDGKVFDFKKEEDVEACKKITIEKYDKCVKNKDLYLTNYFSMIKKMWDMFK